MSTEMRKALEKVRVELAQLVPDPEDPDFSKACPNPADRECLMEAYEVTRAALASPPGERTGEVDAETVIAFLRGSGPLEGVWFGDKHPTEKGAFWWRKYLASLTPQSSGRDAWRTIESAPKDGRFLIGGPTITGNTPWRIEIVSYRDRHGVPIFGHDSFSATHWQPLPSPLGGGTEGEG